jgi:hypothetical protein
VGIVTATAPAATAAGSAKSTHTHMLADTTWDAVYPASLGGNQPVTVALMDTTWD